MRNPVGPLPSSIYWRRRVVALCLLALVAVLVLWAVNSGGGGGGSGNNGSPTHTPASAITPGPDPSGTHITGRPGGRDTSGGSSGSSGGSSSAGGSSGTGGANGGSTSGSSAGTTQGGDSAGAGDSGGSSGAGGTGGTNGTAGTNGSGGSTSSGAGGPLPAGSTLPDCASGAVQLTLRSVKNSYAPGETPTFDLHAANSGPVTCKVDFGPAKAVFTVTAAADSRTHTWASNDCPTGSGSYLLQVPAHSSTTYTLRWNEKTSSPQCATPKGAQAEPGTYLVQAQLTGYPAKQASFVLAQD